MPHGGGHAGGGGFHGGGFYGGGFYGGCHQRRCGAPGSCRYHRYGCRSPRCGLFWLTLLTVGGAVGIIVGVRVGVPKSNSSSHLYAPIDNRLITYSSAFCESLSVRFASSPGDQASSSFQLLSSEPSLTGSDSFQFQENPSFDYSTNYQYWSFFLHQGSRIEFSVCKSEGSAFNYYFIKGHNRFRRWENNPSSNRAEKSGPISSACSSGTRTIVTYDITANDEYYIVFYNPYSSLSTLEINFDIHRTLYIAQPDKVIQSCNVSLDELTCVVGLPMDFNVGLLNIHTSDPVSWSASYGIQVTCNPREWIYAVICSISVFGLLVVFVSIVLCCRYRIQKNEKLQLSREQRRVTPVAAENFVSAGEAPPPYGFDDPPKYKF